tara:strand:+ start:161 stop:634 length:474 start_codon:yes stop_codon:yes gene_type:complete
VVVTQVRQELEVLVVEVEQVGHQIDLQLNLEVQVIHLLQTHHKVMLVDLEDTLLEVLHQVVVEVQLLQVVTELEVVVLVVMEVLVRLIIFLVIVHHMLVVVLVEITIVILQLVVQVVVEEVEVVHKPHKMEQQIQVVAQGVVMTDLLQVLDKQVDQE